jgi:ABC-type multidrug transport system ATPase subunit
MDARGRRSLWEALQSSKHGKTILVSTHSMEEADAIADRIGIVVNGTLKADGDPMDLKAKYGLGYKVHCEMAAGWRSAGGGKGHQPQALVKRISEWAGQHVQGASAAEEGGGTEVTISLGQADVALFPRLFEKLDADMENLGIAGYCIHRP